MSMSLSSVCLYVVLPLNYETHCYRNYSAPWYIGHRGGTKKIKGIPIFGCKSNFLSGAGGGWRCDQRVHSKILSSTAKINCKEYFKTFTILCHILRKRKKWFGGFFISDFWIELHKNAVGPRSGLYILVNLKHFVFGQIFGTSGKTWSSKYTHFW